MKKKLITHENHILAIRNLQGQIEYTDCEWNTEKLVCSLKERRIEEKII